MVRVVLGSKIDKKQIYRAFHLLDSDGSKEISREEVLRVIYKIWRSQLDDLATRLVNLDSDIEDARAKAIIKERFTINEAIKRSYPREWRDMFERSGSHSIPGPFTALLDRMGLHRHNSTVTQQAGPMGRIEADDRDRSENVVDHGNSAGESLKINEISGPERVSGQKPVLPSATAIVNVQPPSSPAKKNKKFKLGNNEVMRYRVLNEEVHVPRRDGFQLQQPKAVRLDNTHLTTGEITGTILKRSEPIGQKLFAPTA